MVDYPEKLGSAATLGPPKELAEYVTMIAKDTKQIRSLEEETDLFGKVFNDPLHGHFEIHPLLMMIIDTPEFQRLRDIKALGCTALVYPGAIHTRFEHCIGVSHLAGELLKALASRQPNLEISRSERLCVQIAGLVHDLGHGPFSHMWEKFMKAAQRHQPGGHFEHEDMSLKMFAHLLDSNGLRSVFKDFGLGEEDIRFIGELILGWKDDRPSAPARPANKRFLYDIIANKRNGIDVDKWDYLARDSQQVGMSGRFDCNRFIRFSRVLVDVDRVTTQIAYRDKEMENLYDMFHIRFKMHKRVYQHRVVKVLDAMICDAILLADPHMSVRGENGRQFRYSEAYKDVTAYRKLSDHVLEEIYNCDHVPALEPARKIIHRIKTRRLYCLLGRTQPEESFEKTEEEVLLQIIATLQDFQAPPLSADTLRKNVLVIKNCYNYGMGRDNPLDEVAFFRKDDPDQARSMSKTEMSPLLPAHFQECEVLIFYRSEDQEELKGARSVVEMWAQRQDLLLNNSSVRMSRLKRKRTEETDRTGNSQAAASSARRQLLFPSDQSD